MGVVSPERIADDVAVKHRRLPPLAGALCAVGTLNLDALQLPDEGRALRARERGSERPLGQRILGYKGHGDDQVTRARAYLSEALWDVVVVDPKL